MRLRVWYNWNFRTATHTAQLGVAYVDASMLCSVSRGILRLPEIEIRNNTLENDR